MLLLDNFEGIDASCAFVLDFEYLSTAPMAEELKLYGVFRSDLLVFCRGQGV